MFGERARFVLADNSRLNLAASDKAQFEVLSRLGTRHVDRGLRHVENM